MKKILLFLIFVIILSSCTGGKNVRFSVKNGDTRITETEEYIITEKCTGCNRLGVPFWDVVSVDRKQKD